MKKFQLIVKWAEENSDCYNKHSKLRKNNQNYGNKVQMSRRVIEKEHVGQTSNLGEECSDGW
jgi:hypothetical protein